MLKVPDERHAQIKALATAKGMSMTDLLAKWIGQEIEAGNLSDGIPGFTVTTLKGRVKLDFVTEQRATRIERAVTMLPSQADGLANQIAKVALHAGTYIDMDVQPNLTVSRVGSAVQIASLGDKTIHSVIAVSVAHDLARLLRKAAKQASAPKKGA